MTHPRWLAAGALLLSACGHREAASFCEDASARAGRRLCVEEIPGPDVWEQVTYPAAAVDQDRATVYLVPARRDAPVPTVFVDATAFTAPESSLHYKFLTEADPELRFLDYEQYLELTLDPDRREWFAGALTTYLTGERELTVGFTVGDLGTEPSATITCDQFEAVRAELAARVRLGELAAIPSNDLQRAVLADCSVRSFDPATALEYEVYTNARGCGTLRRYTLAELAAAAANAELGWQDVLVTDQAPQDLPTVVSGVVTGTRQGELSHLNVRSAARGTPNCYVRDGYERFADLEGKLVALECGATEATVVEISAAEAERCWEEARPAPVAVPAPDLAPAELVGLLELPTRDAAERRAGVSRYGAKGANLATLYQRIEPELRLDGFLVPMHYYSAFVAENGFAERLAEDLADPEFLTDTALRARRLAELTADMEAAPCDSALIDALSAKLTEVFGSGDVMVRFRSSSNAEDALAFNGAGLYDSTSACLADQTDGDASGPSRCDPDEPDERELCRALRKVWASLWSAKAYEERAWYGIDQSAVGMAILVDTRIKGELANVVAFSGNPELPGDDRYLINAQAGELDVVSAEPGVWPEEDLLTLEDHAVTAIERVRGSTQLPDGQWVLDDATLTELGALLAEIVEVYPVDEDPPSGTTVILDTEWKLRDDGTWIVKQVRPFLR